MKSLGGRIKSLGGGIKSLGGRIKSLLGGGIKFLSVVIKSLSVVIKSLALGSGVSPWVMEKKSIGLELNEFLKIETTTRSVRNFLIFLIGKMSTVTRF